MFPFLSLSPRAEDLNESKDGPNLWCSKGEASMKIKLTSVFVGDQEKALQFYTEILGFVKKSDIPVGQFRWLTVVSPDEPDGTELLLEPNDNPAAKTFQSALFEQGIPCASFAVEDIHAEYERLKELGVAFPVPPTPAGGVTIAVLDDTCGNLIQLAQT
jgi:catechol 2,3-dioxygenase-like lactoylglutathione lyase family enzyme